MTDSNHMLRERIAEVLESIYGDNKKVWGKNMYALEGIMAILGEEKNVQKEIYPDSKENGEMVTN